MYSLREEASRSLCSGCFGEGSRHLSPFPLGLTLPPRLSTQTPRLEGAVLLPRLARLLPLQEEFPLSVNQRLTASVVLYLAGKVRGAGAAGSFPGVLGVGSLSPAFSQAVPLPPADSYRFLLVICVGFEE